MGGRHDPGDHPEDNHNPVGRAFYGFSTVVCTMASRAQEGTFISVCPAVLSPRTVSRLAVVLFGSKVTRSSFLREPRAVFLSSCQEQKSMLDVDRYWSRIAKPGTLASRISSNSQPGVDAA